MNAAGNPDRRVFGTAATVTVLIMFIGFSRTYFLKSIFGTPALSGLLHLHGAVMTIWFAVFFAQTRLAGSGRLAQHRRLGWAAAALALLVVGSGYATALAGVGGGHAPGTTPLVFLMLPFSVLVGFVVLTALAIFYRRRGDIHKRLMLLGSLNLLMPAISRIPLPNGQRVGSKATVLVTIGIIVVTVAYDSIKHRRLHPAFAWGGGAMILSLPLRIAFANTAAWLRFATWLVS